VIKQNTLLNQQNTHYLHHLGRFLAVVIVVVVVMMVFLPLLDRDVDVLVDRHTTASRHAYLLKELAIQFGVDGEHEHLAYGRHCLFLVYIMSIRSVDRRK
jgi:hypothetical protein